jgi:hypothetical protein
MNGSDWPVQSIQVGNKSYSKSKATGILGSSSSTDISYTLAKQLITAKLNIANGAPSSCITSTVSAADNWLRSNVVGCRSSRYSSAYQTAKNLANALYSYNIGEECATDCDDDKPICKSDWNDGRDCDYDFSRCRRRRTTHSSGCGWR